MNHANEKIATAKRTANLFKIIALSLFLASIAALFCYFAFDIRNSIYLLLTFGIFFSLSGISAIIFIIKRNAYVNLVNSDITESNDRSASSYGKGQSIALIVIGAILVLLQIFSYIAPQRDGSALLGFIASPNLLTAANLIGENLLLLIGLPLLRFGIRGLKSSN